METLDDLLAWLQTVHGVPPAAPACPSLGPHRPSKPSPCPGA